MEFFDCKVNTNALKYSDDHSNDVINDNSQSTNEQISKSQYNEELKKALSWTNLIKHNHDISSETVQIALDSFLKYLNENQNPKNIDKRVLQSIALIFSMPSFDISEYINNCDFLSYIISNYLTIDPKSIGSIIQSFISKKPQEIIPWLLSPDCCPSFQDFPKTFSFLSLFCRIHTLLPDDLTLLSNELIDDIGTLNIMALSTLDALSYEKLKKSEIKVLLSTLIILITKTSILGLDQNILETVHQLVFIINTKKSFMQYAKLNISVNEDYDFIMKCLEDYDTFPNMLDYLVYIQPEELPLTLIELLIQLFDDSSFKSKVNIFIILEPYIMMIPHPRIIDITSFFIDDDNLGHMALFSTVQLMIKFNTSVIEQSIESIIEKEDELETISCNSTIEGLCASILLDFIHLLDIESQIN